MTSYRMGVLAFAMVIALPAFAQYSSPVRDVENPDRAPFFASVTVSIDNGSSSNFATIAALPAGKRVVIDYVNVRCVAPPADSLVDVYLSVPLGNLWGFVPILLEKQGAGTAYSQYWVGSASMSMRTDTASFNTLAASIARSTATGLTQCGFKVFGHTITLP